MQRQFRKQVKIIRSPHLVEDKVVSSARATESHRDKRPGHFTIKGSFIALPDAAASNGESQRS